MDTNRAWGGNKRTVGPGFQQPLRTRRVRCRGTPEIEEILWVLDCLIGWELKKSRSTWEVTQWWTADEVGQTNSTWRTFSPFSKSRTLCTWSFRVRALESFLRRYSPPTTHTPLTIRPLGTPLNGPESFELFWFGESDRFRPLSTVAIGPGSMMPEWQNDRLIKS